jgi:hypothetical protein
MSIFKSLMKICEIAKHVQIGVKLRLGNGPDDYTLIAREWIMSSVWTLELDKM